MYPPARKYLKGGGMLLATEPTKRLGWCPVPKSGTTFVGQAFAEMNLIEGDQLGSPKNITANFFRLVSSKYSIYAKTYRDMDKLNDLSLFKMVVIRHPFSRLASCYQMMYRGQRWLKMIGDYQRIHMKYDVKDTVSNTPTNMSFPTFVEFVLHEAQNENESFDSISNYSPQALHWWPYTELCGVCNVQYDFIARIETFDSDLQKLIKKFPEYRGVFRKMANKKFVRNTNYNRQKLHSTHYLDLFRQITKVEIQKLYMRFKNDFEFGGYDYPSDYIVVGSD